MKRLRNAVVTAIVLGLGMATGQVLIDLVWEHRNPEILWKSLPIAFLVGFTIGLPVSWARSPKMKKKETEPTPAGDRLKAPPEE